VNVQYSTCSNKKKLWLINTLLGSQSLAPGEILKAPSHDHKCLVND